MKNLLKSLSAFQNEVPTIHEETTGFNYTYSNLNTIFKVIKPLLKKHGLGFYQNLDGRSLVTTVFHAASGEQIQSSSDIPQVTAKDAAAEQLKGTDSHALKSKYIITPAQIEKYNELKKK